MWLLKRAYVLALMLIILAALAFGCISQAQPNPKNATYGYLFYDFNKAHDWKYNVTMVAGNASSTWNMTVHQVNETDNGSILRHFTVDTVGNGMNITYDIWSNATTYQVTRMHAKGSTGNFYQDEETSALQVYTLPDFGLAYYYVPFSSVKTVEVAGADGRIAPATWYAATDNRGFTVAYLINPAVPVPLSVKTIDRNTNVTSMLLDYK